MPFDQSGMPRNLFHWAAFVFAICYFVSYVVGETCQHYLQHPWRHITESFCISTLLAVVFFYWRKEEHDFVRRIGQYAVNAEQRTQDIREQLQILMYRVEDDEVAKKTIANINRMLEH